MEGTEGESLSQAASICKERELGWLFSHPTWEGVHTAGLELSKPETKPKGSQTGQCMCEQPGEKVCDLNLR